MKLHIVNASGQLTAHMDKITVAYERAVETSSELLRLNKVDIVCLADASAVIPEIGIGGYTPNPYLAYVYIDPHFNVSWREIYNTLCHELHHAKRYEGEGYGNTLFDSMIFEGLAIAFEEEVSGKSAFMPSQLLGRTSTPKLLKKVSSQLDSKSFDYFSWFISDPKGHLPRWAGYELGYYIVRKYLELHNKKASQLVLEASSAFAYNY